MLAPRSDANFALFWLAQAASRLGDPITLVAFAAATYRLTESALLTSLAVFVATVPGATIGFLGGSIADAVGFRRAMVACDVARAILVALIAPALTLSLPLVVPFALVGASAMCAAVFNPARVAILPTIVSPERLTARNSIVHTTDRTVEIAGALIAGFLVATVGDLAFVFDGLTFALSAVLLMRLRVQEPPPRRIGLERLRGELGSALSFIANHRMLRVNTVASLLAQASVGVTNALMPVLIFRRFAQGDADLGAQQFGIAEAALAAGSVAMGVLFLRNFRGRKGTLLLIGWAAYGAAYVVISLTNDFAALLVLLALAGAVNVLFYVPNVTLWQQATPDALRGRVIGVRMSMLSLSWLPVLLLSGALADVFDVGLLIGFAGAFTIVVAAVGARVSVLRDAD